jgi:hypothetical protein
MYFLSFQVLDYIRKSMSFLIYFYRKWVTVRLVVICLLQATNRRIHAASDLESVQAKGLKTSLTLCAMNSAVDTLDEKGNPNRMVIRSRITVTTAS